MNVCVIGGCNADFIIKCDNEKICSKTSNVSSVNINAGGVGRNIAVNMHKMGCNVTFITSCGNDYLSHYIEDDLKENDINSLIIRKGNTGIYAAVLKKSGILDTAFCDMKSIEGISASQILESGMDFKRFDGIVIDANLSKNTIMDLCSYFKDKEIPYALESVSNEKCIRIKDSLKGCTFIKPNRYEAEILTGQLCSTFEGVKKCACILSTGGVKNVIISLGSEGFYYYDGNTSLCEKPLKSKVADVTGAGDSMFSAAFTGILKGLKPSDICKAANKCAALTCRSYSSVSNEITPEIF